MNDKTDKDRPIPDTDAPRRPATAPTPNPTPQPTSTPTPTEAPTQAAEPMSDEAAQAEYDDRNTSVQRSGGGADNRVPADQGAAEEGQGGASV